MAHLAHAMAGMAGLGVDEDESKYADVINNLGKKAPPTASPTPTFKDVSAALDAWHAESAREGQSEHMIEFEGNQLHECFQCIMQVSGLAKKKKLLRQFFSNRGLLAGSGDYQEWQLMTTSSISSIMIHFQRYSFGVLSNEFASALDFKWFLYECGILSFLIAMLSLEHPDVAPDKLDPQWKCVAFHSITVIGAMVEMEGHCCRVGCRGCMTKDSQSKVRAIAEKLTDQGVVKWLLKYVGGQSGVMETVKACSVLRELCFISCQASYSFLDHGGLPILGRLFVPGQFEKDVAAIRDGGGFDFHTQLLLAMGQEGFFGDAESETLTPADAYHRAMVHGANLQENAGAAIAYVLDNCKEARGTLLNEKCSLALSATLRWMHMPPMKVGDQRCSQQAVSVIRQVLNSTHATVNRMIQKHNILEILDDWLYPTQGWPINDILQCYLQIARLGGEPRQLLASRVPFTTALAMATCSSFTPVQDPALRLLVTLAQHHPAIVQHLLNCHLLSPDALKRAPRPQASAIGQLEKLQRVCSKACPSRWKKQDAAAVSHFVGDVATATRLRAKTRDELRELGKALFGGGEWAEAAAHYSAGLLLAADRPANADETDALLLSNRAECFLRLGRHDDAVRDSTLAIGMHMRAEDDGNAMLLKCAFRRAKAFLEQGLYFKSLSDAAYCVKQQQTDKRFLELEAKAMAELERSRRSEGHKTSARPRHRTCAGCGLVAPGMKKCSRCEAFFCSKQCLKDNWPSHQKVCQSASK